MVRTQFIPFNEQVFRDLFKQNRVLYGGIYNDDIKIFTAKSPYIRGSGFFTRIAIPFFKKLIAPNLIEFGSNFLSDIASGESAKSSAKRRGMESLKKTAKKLLTGEGRKNKKRKMSCSKTKTKTKRRYVKKKSYKPKFGGKKKRRKYSRKKKRVIKKTSKKRKCIFDSNFGI